MNANRNRYCNGTSALKPECSRYGNENERIIDYACAAARWNQRGGNFAQGATSVGKSKACIRDILSSAVDESATMRDLRSGSLSGTPVNKSDSWKMNWYAVIYTGMALIAIVGAAV